MKLAVLFSVFITVAELCAARPRQIADLSTVNGNPYTDSTLKTSASVPLIFSEILAITNSSVSFQLKQADVLNLEVSHTHNKNYILYNPDFTDWITRVMKNKWGIAALLAHEIGHHQFGHIRKKTKRQRAELEADEFAGATLAKMGATLEESQEVMLYIASMDASETHPGREARMNAIKKGWEKFSALQIEK